MINRFLVVLLSAIVMITACGPAAQIRKASAAFAQDSALAGAHIGISVFDPSKERFLYDRAGDHYFVPASNTKIITCFAAMKFLGDSVAGVQYLENDTAIFLFPTGDPGFLHPDFRSQPVADFIRKQVKPLYISNSAWKTQAMGSGWQWDDYNDEYSAERSAFPVYGNCIRWYQEQSGKASDDSTEFDQSVFIYSVPEVDMPVRFDPSPNARAFHVTRDVHANAFSVEQGSEVSAAQAVPFLTNGISTGLSFLEDTLHHKIIEMTLTMADSLTTTLYSRPVDSVLLPMMHRSDNFFAEQLLLMVSKKLTGLFDEQALIDSLLRTELVNMPGSPRWVDGSGLSRYNLFSPRQFVYVLDRMQQEFSFKRLESIFPGTGTGTLSRFDAGANKVIAKTGTMSGVVALSGFVITPAGKTRIFSILVNNHRSSASAIRKEMGKLLSKIR